MAKPDIGEIRHQCGTVAGVRRDKNGGLYLACSTCGLVRMSLPGGQSWILENATIYGPAGKPEPAPPPAPEPPAAKPAAAPAPKPAAAPPPPPPAATRRPFLPTIFD